MSFAASQMKEVEDIVKSRVDGAKDERLFESITTLMTNLLRGVIERSIRALHGLLTRFQDAPELQFTSSQVTSILAIDQADRPETGLTPVFAVRLVVQRRKISLQV